MAQEQKVLALPAEVAGTLDRAYAFVDLEVSSEDIIYRMGVVAPQTERDYHSNRLQDGFATLTVLCASGVGVCGHNFRRFDHDFLVEQRPELRDWNIVDTLELSLLAYPLQASHRLSKDYKLSQYAGNDPLEDARATRLLLHHTLTELACLPLRLFDFYIWLLTCGDEPADRAYGCPCCRTASGLRATCPHSRTVAHRHIRVPNAKCNNF